MKKLLTLLTLVLLGMGSTWAQSTIGLTQANDGTPTGDYNGTLAEAVYTGATNLTVTEAHGAGCGINQSGRKTTGPDGDYLATKCFRKTTKASDWEATTWVGYTVEVASGYKMSLTNLKATLWDANSNATFTWRVVVENSSGTALYTSDKKTSSTSSIGVLEVASPTGLSDMKTGTYTIKLQLYQNGGNKYFSVPYLTADATVEEDASATYTVTTSATPAEGGTVTPETGEQVEGSNVILTATPNTGYKFVKWTIDGTDYTTNPYTISSIDAAHNAVATFEALPKITFDKGEGMGTAPSAEYAEAGATYTLPKAFFLYKDGATLTGWSDGDNTYALGATYNITGDVNFTAVFSDNTVAIGDGAAIVDWTFATKDGAPTISCEGSELDYVQQATINGTAIDVVMHINTRQDAGISGSKGKVNNTSADNRAQVNKGTIFTIPAMVGMVITITATNTGSASVSSMKFDGNDADSYASGVLTYTYTGSASTIDIIDQGNNLYPSGITVSYPVKPSKCATPTISVGDFSFANKGYAVTITSANTLWVSTDGTNYTEQTSPYVTTVTATTTFYAKATDSSLEDSEVAEQEVICNFDSSKKFVAWVYTAGYGSASYAFATDPMVAALQNDYNVVEVNNAAGDAPAADLANADLIVCTEAMTGNKTLSNGMKDFAGVTPMIGLKAFNYTKGRWSWGTPANPSPTAQAFTPKSGLYKLLDGVIFESDGTIQLATATSGNVIQTVEFGTTDCTAPAGNTILGTLGGDDKKAVMYASEKYFGLGLSSDCWATYTDNAIAIVKNAAALLIAGSDLTAEDAITAKQKVKVTAAGYATYCSPYPLNFDGVENLTAYTASVASNMVSFTPATSVPAETGLLLKGVKDTETIFQIPVAASTTDVSANKFMGVTTATEVAAGIFVLMDGEKGVGFYKTQNAFTVGANTAYLPADVATARTFIGFDSEETTGIENANVNLNLNDEVFDLQGRRVAQPTKGLYIVNGKKVVK